MIVKYDSIMALRNSCIDLARKKGYYGFSRRVWGGNSWFGHESIEDTLRYSELGKIDLVPLAERIMDQLETEIETPIRTWERSPVGGYCRVPELLSGLPTPMRRRTVMEDEGAPITIVAITSSSGGIGTEILTKRGVVILALVLALSKIRPIELHVCDIGDGYDKDRETIVTARVNTQPLDLATACYCLTSPGFTRRLVYTVCHCLNGSHGGWPPGYYFGRGNEKWLPTLYPKLGLDPKHSLIIDACRLNDELLKDPIVWVNKQIKRFVQIEQEEC